MPAIRADTILLKNGRSIQADSAVERNGRVEYTIGESTFTIPGSLVEKIDTAAPLNGLIGATSPAPLPAPPRMDPALQFGNFDEIEARIIRNGAIDDDAIAAIDKQKDPAVSAAAHWVAARYARDHGELKEALAQVEQALSFEPREDGLLSAKSALLITLGDMQGGAAAAERSAGVNPRSAYAWSLLGYAQLQLGNNAAAVGALAKSLEINPGDAAIQKLMTRAKLDSSLESRFQEERSEHFVLHFAGQSVSPDLRHDLLGTLERQYRELETLLGASPPAVTVIAYTGRAFFDSATVPRWASAYNDGKLRISVEGVSRVTPPLASLMKHELAHSFIAQITHQRCPTWLNEGIAEWAEPRGVGENGHRLALLYAGQHEIPLNQLEGPFLEFNGSEAALAYAESLAVVQFIASTYGPGSLAAILRLIGKGQPPEAALRAVIHGGYSDLELQLTHQLQKNYGG